MANGEIAVIGAGVVGAAVACALAREGRKVVLYDRADPGRAGASFGNAGDIATELVEPLPSVPLLFNFWKELFVFDGPLDMPLARALPLFPWSLRFVRAAFQREAHTKLLAPLVRPGAEAYARWLAEIGRPELLRRNGHYEIFLGGDAKAGAQAQAAAMARVEVRTQPAPEELVEAARKKANAATAAGLFLPDCAHVTDPLEVVRALVDAAVARGAKVRRSDVHEVRVRNGGVEVITAEPSMRFDAAVICAGVWSARLLAPLGLKAPLEAASGYHVELPGEKPLADAPILYSRERVVMTPMSTRVRATSHMEFSGIDATPDPRKPAQLRRKLQRLGFACSLEGPSWMGPRPVLPDYLPGIGRAAGTRVFYCIGHHHVGLTTAPTTAELVADLVAARAPRIPLEAFDLKRFG